MQERTSGEISSAPRILSGSDILSSPCFTDTSTTNPAVQVWITLLGRRGCCLCDEALLEVVSVIERLKQSYIVSEMLGNVDDWIRVVQRDIEENQDLKARFHQEIPVLFLNGRQNCYWKVNRERLFADILKAMKAQKALDEIRIELIKATRGPSSTGPNKRKFKRKRK